MTLSLEVAWSFTVSLSMFLTNLRSPYLMLQEAHSRSQIVDCKRIDIDTPGYTRPTTGIPIPSSDLYSLACVCAFFNTGSIFVAFITSPLTFSLPDMKSRCACVLPLTSFPKSSSDSDRVTVDDLVTYKTHHPHGPSYQSQ